MKKKPHNCHCEAAVSALSFYKKRQASRSNLWEHLNFEESQTVIAFRERGTGNRERQIKYFGKYEMHANLSTIVISDKSVEKNAIPTRAEDNLSRVGDREE